jgi:Ca2+-binding EF-hand superfamily protein
VARETEIQVIFNKYDIDGDGFLDGIEELKAAFSDANHIVTDEELKEIVAFADDNNDGKVSFEEFSNFVL